MAVQSVLKNQFQFNYNANEKAEGFVYILGPAQKKSEFSRIVKQHAYPDQVEKLLTSDKRTLHFTGPRGNIWILLGAPPQKKGGHGGLFDESTYAWFRDQCGSLVSYFKSLQPGHVNIYFYIADESVVRGAVVGLEMAAYNFLASYNAAPAKFPALNLIAVKPAKLDKKNIEKYQIEARAVALARHLVNLPPNEINPETIESAVRKNLEFGKKVEVDVWDQKRLAAENMNLHLAVGRGSETPPRMIHIRYRPQKRTAKKPIAFVGKGITFDTGGLDIKPSSGMRLMKKDMGGAAAVLAVAYWVAHSGYSRACDFYLALAENSVDAKAMRPSDLYRSRAGLLVEIDNTDAEGRLVLADSIDVAVTKKGADEPEYVIDVATLTGAIKVALGADVAGLFSNDDALAAQLEKAGQAAGESSWRMPLVQKYFSSMSSPFADFKNSADGFGGAITAALFLEKFVRAKKWAHLDVYCWTDKPGGALSSAGASGQPVQSLIQWLKTVG